MVMAAVSTVRVHVSEAENDLLVSSDTHAELVHVVSVRMTNMLLKSNMENTVRMKCAAGRMRKGYKMNTHQLPSVRKNSLKLIQF